jgi:hypothetical protein
LWVLVEASPGADRREPPDIAATCIIDGRGALAVGLSAADDPASGIVIGDRVLAVGGRAAEAVAARIVVRALLLRRGSAGHHRERQQGEQYLDCRLRHVVIVACFNEFISLPFCRGSRIRRRRFDPEADGLC